MICYAIKDWDKHFENSESRKIKSLTWLPVKNKHDGKGYRRVVAHPKSIQVFCAWNLMIQVASKMPVRGVLRDEDGPITTSDLSFKTGYPEHIFEEAFKVLSDNKVGWLVQVKDTENPPVLGDSPDASVDVGIEGNGREQKGTEGNGTEPPPLPPSGEKVVAKGELQLRAERLMRRKPETPLTEKERRAFAKNRAAIIGTSEEDWLVLEAFYAAPQAQTYARKDLLTLVNNWNGEIDRAKAWHKNPNANSKRVNTRNLGTTETAESKSADVQKFLESQGQSHDATA